MRPLFDDQPLPTATPNVNSTVATFNVNNPVRTSRSVVKVTDEQISSLGQKQVAKLAPFTQEMLSQVKASDADGFGVTLNQLVTTAKGMDPAKFKSGGILGKVSGMFGSVKEKMLAQYSSVEHRMDALVVELDKYSVTQTKRIGDLEGMYDVNYQGHVALEQEVDHAQQLVALLNEELQEEKKDVATNSFAAQTIADTSARLQRAEKKIDDLTRGMLFAKQTAPQIRLMQDNARTLVEKFGNLKTITLPAWKQVFTLYLVQLEQKKGAALATAVDDATNEAFVKQADLLRQNTQEIAKAKEAPLVTYETLEHVQQQLLGAFDDMQQIAEQGRQARLQAAPKIKALEQQLIDRFVKS